MHSFVPPGAADKAGVHHGKSDSDCLWRVSRWDSSADGSDCSKQRNEGSVKKSDSLESVHTASSPDRILHGTSGDGQRNGSAFVCAHLANMQRDHTPPGVYFF